MDSMKQIAITTTVKKMLADVYTPVGIYLRVRDRFRDAILLESTDNHVAENSYSFIGINAIAGIEITNPQEIEYKLPAQQPQQLPITRINEVPQQLWDFMNYFSIQPAAVKEAKFAQGLFGYSTYDAVQFFDSITLKVQKEAPNSIPLMRYRLYQYVIVINHHKNELYLCENVIEGLKSELLVIEGLIKSKDVPTFPFAVKGAEISNMTDADYIAMVKTGIKSCLRGDVFSLSATRLLRAMRAPWMMSRGSPARSMSVSYRLTGEAR
jgi:anthranilate synthase component 1